MKTVTAAIVRRELKVLVTRRAAGQKLAGFWEFPGGKVEEGESLEECLRRELREELGIVVRVGSVYAESIYEYDDGVIRLVALHANIESGEPTTTVHDRVEWMTASDLLYLQFAPADVPIARQLANESINV